MYVTSHNRYWYYKRFWSHTINILGLRRFWTFSINFDNFVFCNWILRTLLIWYCNDVILRTSDICDFTRVQNCVYNYPKKMFHKKVLRNWKTWLYLLQTDLWRYHKSLVTKLTLLPAYIQHYDLFYNWKIVGRLVPDFEIGILTENCISNNVKLSMGDIWHGRCLMKTGEVVLLIRKEEVTIQKYFIK